jgi:4-amino-4-deoxy-L-arabinose transferase-like glycosyltransferase
MGRAESIRSSGDRHPLALWGLLGLAAWYWGYLAGIDAPFVYHHDEPTIARRALEMTATGDLDPRWFRYPSLLIYLQAALYALLRPWIDVPLDAAMAPAACQGMPPIVFPYVHWGRFVTVAFALGTTLQIHRLVSRMGPHWAALGAAALFCASPVATESAFRIAVDMPMAFFVVSALERAVRAVGRVDARRVRADCAMLAVCGGLAAGMKYNGALVLALVPVVLLLRRTPLRAGVRITAEGAVLSVVVFLLTTPYALLDSARFLHPWVGMPYDFLHYTRGHLGHDRGLSAIKSLETIWQTLGPFCATVPLGFVLLRVSGRRARVVPLLVTVAVFWLPVVFARVYFPRNVLLVTALLGCLAALGASVLADGLARVTAGRGRAAGMVARALVPLAVAAGLWWQSADAVGQALAERRLRDVRTDGYRWMVEHLPPGTRVLSEWYTPQVQFAGGRFEVVCAIHIARLEWAKLAGRFDVVLVSSSMKGRFPDPSTTTYAMLSEERLLARWRPDAGSGTKGPVVELYRIE